jgi:hypothetical protein
MLGPQLLLAAIHKRHRVQHLRLAGRHARRRRQRVQGDVVDEGTVVLRVPVHGHDHHVKGKRAPQRVDHRHNVICLERGGSGGRMR